MLRPSALWSGAPPDCESCRGAVAAPIVTLVPCPQIPRVLLLLLDRSNAAGQWWTVRSAQEPQYWFIMDRTIDDIHTHSRNYGACGQHGNRALATGPTVWKSNVFPQRRFLMNVFTTLVHPKTQMLEITFNQALQFLLDWLLRGGSYMFDARWGRQTQRSNSVIHGSSC